MDRPDSGAHARPLVAALCSTDWEAGRVRELGTSVQETELVQEGDDGVDQRDSGWGKKWASFD